MVKKEHGNDSVQNKHNANGQQPIADSLSHWAIYSSRHVGVKNKVGPIYPQWYVE